jgi:hypothetical protein
MKIFRNTPVYMVAYLLFMLPTYILPYFGSNSSLINAMGMGMGLGFPPQWWAHAWSLVMLAMIAWVRGGWIGKSYLPIFPVLAGVFDMFPILSAIPLVPTVFHVVALIVGVMVSQTMEADQEANDGVARKSLMGVGIMTLAAIGGTILFFASIHKKSNDFEAARNSLRDPSPVAMAPWRAVEKQPKAPSTAPTAALAEVVAPGGNKPTEQPAPSNKPSELSSNVAYSPSREIPGKALTPVARSKPTQQSNDAGFTTLDKANIEIDRAITNARR